MHSVAAQACRLSVLALGQLITSIFRRLRRWAEDRTSYISTAEIQFGKRTTPSAQEASTKKASDNAACFFHRRRTYYALLSHHHDSKKHVHA
jgi:hypothetical protein